jgi:hypothetical protein
LLVQPWYARSQGQPIWLGFAWPLALAVVAVGTWWVIQNALAVVGAAELLRLGFWWLSGERTKPEEETSVGGTEAVD